MTAKKVLITGGLGFLGHHLAHHFHAHPDFEPVLLDEAPAAGVDLDPGVRVYQADVRDRAAVARIFKEEAPQLVVHAAARLPLDPPAEVQSTTINGTKTMIAEAARAGVERFVFQSSTAVYYPGGRARHDEAAPLLGVGPYGEAKIVAEEACARARTDTMAVTVLRPKSFTGPARLGIFQFLCQWLAEGRRIPMIGSGRYRYQLLDVEDLCTATALVLTLPPDQVNDTFNVGAARYGLIRDDLAELCDRAGTGSRPLPTPLIATRLGLATLYHLRISPLYPWIYRTAGEDSVVPIDKLQALGWEPQHSNVDALWRTYSWWISRDPEATPAAAPRSGHRVPWSEGALRLVRHLL